MFAHACVCMGVRFRVCVAAFFLTCGVCACVCVCLCVCVSMFVRAHVRVCAVCMCVLAVYVCVRAVCVWVSELQADWYMRT